MKRHQESDPCVGGAGCREPQLLPQQTWVFGGTVRDTRVLLDSESCPLSAPRVSEGSVRDSVDQSPGEQVGAGALLPCGRCGPGRRPSSCLHLSASPSIHIRSLTHSVLHCPLLRPVWSCCGVRKACGGAGAAGGPASLGGEDIAQCSEGTGLPGRQAGTHSRNAVRTGKSRSRLRVSSSVSTEAIAWKGDEQ